MRNCLSDKRYFSCRWSSDYGYREMYSLHGMHPYLYGTGENSSASITAENGTDAWCLKGCQKQKWSVLIRRSSIPKDSSICYLRMNDKIIAVIGYKEISSLFNWINRNCAPRQALRQSGHRQVVILASQSLDVRNWMSTERKSCADCIFIVPTSIVI